MPARYSRARRAFERFRQMDTRTDVFERADWDNFNWLYWHDKREEQDGETIFEFGFWTGRKAHFHRCKLVFLPWDVKKTASLVVTTHNSRGEDEPVLVTRSLELRSFDRFVEVLDSTRWYYSGLCVGFVPHVLYRRQTVLFVRRDE